MSGVSSEEDGEVVDKIDFQHVDRAHFMQDHGKEIVERTPRRRRMSRLRSAMVPGSSGRRRRKKSGATEIENDEWEVLEPQPLSPVQSLPEFEASKIVQADGFASVRFPNSSNVLAEFASAVSPQLPMYSHIGPPPGSAICSLKGSEEETDPSVSFRSSGSWGVVGPLTDNIRLSTNAEAPATGVRPSSIPGDRSELSISGEGSLKHRRGKDSLRQGWFGKAKADESQKAEVDVRNLYTDEVVLRQIIVEEQPVTGPAGLAVSVIAGAHHGMLVAPPLTRPVGAALGCVVGGMIGRAKNVTTYDLPQQEVPASHKPPPNHPIYSSMLAEMSRNEEEAQAVPEQPPVFFYPDSGE